MKSANRVSKQSSTFGRLREPKGQRELSSAIGEGYPGIWGLTHVCKQSRLQADRESSQVQRPGVLGAGPEYGLGQ